MLLRLVMMGAVASLGFDLPTAKNVEHWTSAGQVWWDATLSQWVIPQAEEVPEPLAETEEPPDESAPSAGPVGATTPEIATEPVAPVEAIETDRSFDGVVDQIVSAFVADDARVAAADASATPSFEPVEVGDDLYPGLAYELNRASEGAPRPIAAPVAVAAVSTPERVETGVEADTRGPRLAAAVRLTGQAMQAWMSLLRHDTTIVSARE